MFKIFTSPHELQVSLFHSRFNIDIMMIMQRVGGCGGGEDRT